MVGDFKTDLAKSERKKRQKKTPSHTAGKKKLKLRNMSETFQMRKWLVLSQTNIPFPTRKISVPTCTQAATYPNGSLQQAVWTNQAQRERALLLSFVLFQQLCPVQAPGGARRTETKAGHATCTFPSQPDLSHPIHKTPDSLYFVMTWWLRHADPSSL